MESTMGGKPNFEAMTKEDALTYCYEHERQFKADLYASGEDGERQFDCLIAILEGGTNQPKELTEYGMDN